MIGEKQKSSIGRRLLSGSVLRLGNLVAAGGTAFFLTPFIVHHLGDRLYGFWALATAFIGYYSLLDFGLSSAVSQYLCAAIGRKDETECHAVFNTALRFQSLLGGLALLTTAVIAAATPWLCHNPTDARQFWRVIAILGTSVALGFPTRVYGGVLEADLRFATQSGLTLLGLVLRVGLIICAIKGGGGLQALAWATLFASLPSLALQVWFARRAATWARISHLSLDVERAKSFVSYSVYTFVAVIADILRFQIDPVVISSFIGLASVTHYKIASLLTSYYLNGLIALASIFQPVLSRLHGAGDRSGLEKVFYFATKVTVCVSVFTCFAIIGWGRPLIARWMGPSYEDAYRPLAVLSVAVFLDVCQSPSIGLLYAISKHRYYAYLNLTEGVINLLCSLALVRPLGILGVALGTLIAAVVIRVVAQPIVVCRISGLSYGRYIRFLGSNLVRYGCVTAAAIAMSAWGLRPNYIWLVGSAVLCTGIYSVGCWLFVFNRREREQLLGALRKTDNRIEPVSLSMAVT